ncbi:MAG TPA: hypothetical protein VH331_10570 [Allosphingosinicella sp.]|jgi:hypothetical protein|nr:hypothetical protein [Allosphingosinicella sp.]
MELTLDAIFQSPDFHLFAFENERAIFRAMDRDAYRRSVFLDGRIETANPNAFALPVPLLTSFADRAPVPRSGWIFHVAHCGSTLLARALDLPDRNLVLREPLALRQVGVERANAAATNEAWRAKLRLAAILAGRRYRPDAPAIVKANVPVNFIASELLALDAEAPAIFLYFPLRTYLLAVLRSPGHRQWVVNVTTALEPCLRERVGSLDGLSVPHRAAALWLAQMLLYAEAIARFPEARSLHAGDLFEDPRSALIAAAAHLGTRLSGPEAESIAAGEIFSTYSKDPGRKFDNEERQAQQASIARAIEPEIASACAWVEALEARRALREHLDRPLIASSPLLIDV